VNHACQNLALVWCLLLLIAAIVLSARSRSVDSPLDVARIVSQTAVREDCTNLADSTNILFDIRLPRTLLILLAGAALSGSGAAYQGLFRNPLADPYIIGVPRARAGRGDRHGLHWRDDPGRAGDPNRRVRRGVDRRGAVYGLARVGSSTPIATLILAGVAIGSFTTAMTTFLMLGSQAELRRAISWMLGGFAFGGWLPVVASLPTSCRAAAAVAAGARTQRAAIRRRSAQQMGLRVDRVKLAVVMAASLATAAAVAFAGIIGLWACRAAYRPPVVGGDYRRLIPLSIIAGARCCCSPIFCAHDHRAAGSAVGVVTAMFGAPVLLVAVAPHQAADVLVRAKHKVPAA